MKSMLPTTLASSTLGTAGLWKAMLSHVAPKLSPCGMQYRCACSGKRLGHRAWFEGSMSLAVWKAVSASSSRPSPSSAAPLPPKASQKPKERLAPRGYTHVGQTAVGSPKRPFWGGGACVLLRMLLRESNICGELVPESTGLCWNVVATAF